MRSALARDVTAAVRNETRRATDPLLLQRAVAAQVARAVPYDLWCGLTVDPRTGDPTGGYHEDGLPQKHLARLVQLEQSGKPDFVVLRDLVRGGGTAQTLARATDGDLARSPRYRDVLHPSGVGQEVRVAMRGSDRLAWAAMILFRGDGDRDFSAAELDLLRTVGRLVADGHRRAMTLARQVGRTEAPYDGSPGLLLCTVGDTITLDHASEAAHVWLEQIEDGRLHDLPFALATLVHAAHRRAGPAVHRLRLRTRDGRWLTAHAERLGDYSVSVILEAARSEEIRELLADAYRLTAREREVAELAAQGLTNREIAAALHLSPYTVGDHLKAVFAKTGSRSRTGTPAGGGA